MTCHCNHEHQGRIETFTVDGKLAHRAYCQCCDGYVGKLTTLEDARSNAERHRGEKRRELVG